MADPTSSPEDERFPIFARNRYFTGKVLDADDFSDEQGYILGKDRLRNRTLHGWGVVDGLEVVPGEDATEIIVEPGMAIDGWGREIVVSSPCRLDLVTAAGRDDEGTRGTAGDRRFTVRIAYAEFDRDAVPALIEGDAPVFERTVEGHTLLIEPGLPERSGASGAGLPEDPSVVLATVKRPKGSEQPVLDTATYRRELRSTAELLEIVDRLEKEVAALRGAARGSGAANAG